MIRLADIIPVEVDHSQILDMDMCAATVQLLGDADGQWFPWLDGNPRIGSVVYWDGGLWEVVDRESGAASEGPSAITLLVPAWMPFPVEGPRGVARAELRPVTWTQDLELDAQRRAGHHYYHYFECLNWACTEACVADVRSRSAQPPVQACPFCLVAMEYRGSEPSDRDGFSPRH